MDFFGPPELITLPLDLHHEIGDLLDIVSLLSWGGTCFYFRDLVSAKLKAERDTIIERYWVGAPQFLSLLTEYQAVITGQAALAFVTRDKSLLGEELEISVGARSGDALLQELESYSFLQHAMNDEEWPALSHLHPTSYLYITNNGHLIRVNWSHTDSAFTPMTFSSTTALFNYMDAFSFGSAYRDLTVNHRGVAPNFDRLAPHEAARVLNIAQQGEFRQSPWAASVSLPPRPFALYNLFAAFADPNAEELSNTVCLRRSYQCMGQTRFFGDGGSLLDFFDPDTTDHAVMAHCAYPPYGPTAMWRLDGPPCDYYCVEGDHLLHDDFSSVCILPIPLHYGPFTTATVGRPKVGESQHRRVWNATKDNIRMPDRGVYFHSHG